MATKRQSGYLTIALILLLVYTLLIGVGVTGDAFKWISGGEEGAKAMFAFATNPIVGVIIGILATAVVQSSSTVTSVIVGIVAGGIPVATAIPMIMGANMGTTITNTIVSFGSISQSEAFKKSFSAATVHDFFNLYSILIFLPIEILFHPLEHIGAYSSKFLIGDGGIGLGNMNFLKKITQPIQNFIQHDIFALFPESIGPVFMITTGIGLIIIAVIFMGKVLKSAMTETAKKSMQKAFGKGAFMGILYGTVITILVQSSSTTTSLIVPLAGAGLLSIRQVFPFTMGANIGTCITAVLAATAISGAREEFALQIAMVHLAYNVLGVALFISIKFLRELPIQSAEWLAKKSAENKLWAFSYILSIFFVLPGLVFLIQSNLSDDPQQDQLKIENIKKIEKEDFIID